MNEETEKEKKIDLSPIAESTLHLLTKNKPYFPEFLSKKLCEQVGL